MRLLWLSVLGAASLCLPAAVADEASRCAPGQLLGQWHVLGIATNCGWMVEFVVKEPMAAHISSQEEGSFTVTTSIKTQYGAMDVDMTYTKQENGTYLHKSEWGDKIIERWETDCKTHIITCIRDQEENEGRFCKFVTLYARAMPVDRSVERAFVAIAAEMQIEREQIFLLARKDVSAESASPSLPGRT